MRHGRQTRTILAVLTTAALTSAALTACDGSDNDSARSTTAELDGDATRADLGDARRPEDLVRCANGIGGLGPIATDPAWRERSLIAGPFGIYGARSDLPRIPKRDLQPLSEGLDGPRYGVRPLLVFARKGSISTVAVVGQARDHAVLAPSLPGDGTNGYTLSDGTSVLTLRGCRKDIPYTVFSAGLIADGPQCVPIEVTVEGRAVPIRRVIAYGLRDCAGYRDSVPPRT